MSWEAFFNYYLEKEAPELLEDLDTDPEAGMYAAYYDLSAENEDEIEWD
ncbi:MAG: immunity 51 family protein [Lachnospiraceae bacterium]|nr:immunity 51 family protein [Lachnospiraceae bacterium]